MNPLRVKPTFIPRRSERRVEERAITEEGKRMTRSTPRREKSRPDEEKLLQIRGRSSSETRMQGYPQASWGEHLESVFIQFAALRGISAQQLVILKSYLEGKNDKEIADICRCSGATVHEHWRRMAKKSGGSRKRDVIADFHRFLGGR
jgi:DNA-binding CsgD family transcriptional regulator